MAHVASASVARPTSKPEKGQPFRMHVILTAELVEAIDRFRVKLAEQEFATGKTRTEAVTALLREGLKKRGLLK